MTRILIAPDSFKGSAAAAEVAAALAEGWSSVRPADAVGVAPMADGGEGTLEAFATAFPASVLEPVRVTGPDGDPVDATWLRLPDGRAVVELASTSGLTLLDELRPDAAHTRGFGEAIAAALAAGATGLVLGIGGSGSTDGGAGLLSVLGARLADSTGARVRPGGTGLDDLVSIDLGGLRPLPSGGVLVVTDVTAPLLGPAGAAAVFGPQKGVTAERVPVHEARLRRFASLVPQVDPDTPGAGAAGGAGFGLLAWGATLVPGAAAVADALRLTDRMAGVDLVITGEGRFDDQSTTGGKAPEHVRMLAARAHAAVALVAGSISGDTRDFAAAVALTDLAGSADTAMAEPLRWLREAGAALARGIRLPD